MPAVNDDWLGHTSVQVGVDHRGDGDILLVPADQRSEGKGIGKGVALGSHHIILLREDGHGYHGAAGRDRLGRHLDRGIRPNLIHHLARRQGATERITEALGQERRRRLKEIIGVGANG